MIPEPSFDYSPFCTLQKEFRAHTEYITSIRVISSTQTIISSSKDMSIRLWTLHGEHIGIFGQEIAWDLSDSSTFQALPEETKREIERDRERQRDLLEQTKHYKKMSQRPVSGRSTAMGFDTAIQESSSEVNESSTSIALETAQTDLARIKFSDSDSLEDWKVTAEFLSLKSPRVNQSKNL